MKGYAPYRVGMIQAYGNAIVPEVAAIFVRAFADTLTQQDGGFDPPKTSNFGKGESA